MKSRQLYTFFLPDLVTDGVLEDSTVVVIDILRATTTMTTALANGAARIVPCVGIDQAHLAKQRLGQAAIGDTAISNSHPPTSTSAEPISSAAPVLLGGERLGKPLPGFDLGNAPETYTPIAVSGRTIVMTTTNGTRALDRCRGAKQIVVGSFANLSRVVQHLQNAEKVVLVCSGTDRHVTCEDVLFAGAVCDELVSASSAQSSGNGSLAADPPTWKSPTWKCSDSSELARCFWQQLPRHAGRPTATSILKVFSRSLGGSNLIAQGRGADLEFAARIDRFDNLPVLDQQLWQITNGQ